jgi:hypothetical protein
VQKSYTEGLRTLKLNITLLLNTYSHQQAENIMVVQPHATPLTPQTYKHVKILVENLFLVFAFCLVRFSRSKFFTQILPCHGIFCLGLGPNATTGE